MKILFVLSVFAAHFLGVMAYLECGCCPIRNSMKRNPKNQNLMALGAGGQVPMVPYYVDKARKDYMWMDIYNALGRERTLFVARYIDDEAANQLISSLVYLNSKSSEPIRIYFNVPGAMAKPAMAVYDVLKSLSCTVETINMGLTVGLGCLLIAAGTRTKRFVTPNARFLVGKAGLDDPVNGQSADISLQVKEVLKYNKRSMEELAKLCKIDPERLMQDTQRDFYLTAPEAVQYGLVDAVLVPPQPIKIMRNREVDNHVINYGHFSEVRPVRGGPLSRGFSDPIIPRDPDEVAREEMEKKIASQKTKGERPRDPRFMPPGWGNGPPTTSGGGNNNNNNNGGSRWKGL